MKDQDAERITDSLARKRNVGAAGAQEAGSVETAGCGPSFAAGPYSGTGSETGHGRHAIRSEINRLTRRIEQLKALDGALAKELSPLAEDAVAQLVLGSR